MKWFKEHMVGILGTVIVHLSLAIIFMVFKITTFKPYHEGPVVITFEPEAQSTPPEEAHGDKYTDAELEAMIHNIAVNRALDQQEDFDINEYIKQVKEEMVEDGELNKEAIDQWQESQEAADAELSATLPEKKLTTDSSLTASEVLASDYKGPTRVEYYLKDRIARNIKIPVYKCEGSGMVIMAIEVNREGKVTSANPVKEKSSENQCMLDAAKEAALASTFNKAPGAPLVVSGSITYYFVAQ